MHILFRFSSHSWYLLCIFVSVFFIERVIKKMNITTEITRFLFFSLSSIGVTQANYNMQTVVVVTRSARMATNLICWIKQNAKKDGKCWKARTDVAAQQTLRMNWFALFHTENVTHAIKCLESNLREYNYSLFSSWF